jgi:curved DNA-binding protein CbpA
VRRGNSVDGPASEGAAGEGRFARAERPAKAAPPSAGDDFEDRPTGVMFEELPTGLVQEAPAQVAAPPQPAPVAAPAPAPSLPPRDEVPDAALQERMREVDALYERLGELNYYQLLGLPTEADEEGVKQAYFLLARRFHPDSYFRKPIGGRREKLELIFKVLTRAHEVLRSPEMRAEYDAAHRIAKRSKPSLTPEPAPMSSKTSAVFPRVAASGPSKPPAATPAAVVSTRPPATYGTNSTPPNMRGTTEVVSSAPPRAAKQPNPAPASKPPQAAPRAPVATQPQQPAPAPSAASNSSARSIAPPRSSAREALLKSLEARRRVPGAPAQAKEPVQASPSVHGRAFEDSPLGVIADDLAKRGDNDSTWAANQLRQALKNERAGETVAVVAILQTVMTRVSDPRLRELRDKLHKQGLQAGATEHRNKALQAEQSNSLKEAAEHWRKVLEAEPNDAKAALHAAACLIKAGDVRGAGLYAKRAVELAPNDPNARKVALRFYDTMGMSANANRERDALTKLTKK